MNEQVTVQGALAAVMADVQAVAKKDRNSAQGFNFRGIDAVVNAVGPALRAHGVVVLPNVLSLKYDTVEVGRNRTAMGHVLAHVEYVFVGPAGDVLACTVYGEAMDSGDKAVPKAMSVAFRTALLQALALPTDEPDPDASSYERAPAKPEISAADFEAAQRSMATAGTVDELNEIAGGVNNYAMADQARQQLRETYLKRKAELAGGEQV
jgi:hypothetical protein